MGGGTNGVRKERSFVYFSTISESEQIHMKEEAHNNNTKNSHSFFGAGMGGRYASGRPSFLAQEFVPAAVFDGSEKHARAFAPRKLVLQDTAWSRIRLATSIWHHFRHRLANAAKTQGVEANKPEY